MFLSAELWLQIVWKWALTLSRSGLMCSETMMLDFIPSRMRPTVASFSFLLESCIGSGILRWTGCTDHMFFEVFWCCEVGWSLVVPWLPQSSSLSWLHIKVLEWPHQSNWIFQVFWLWEKQDILSHCQNDKEFIWKAFAFQQPLFPAAHLLRAGLGTCH